MASKLSSGPLTRYLIAHPEEAPEEVRPGFEHLHDLLGARKAAAAPGASLGGSGPMKGAVFNLDVTGLPQNEESVTSCPKQPRYVLSGTNDYRGLLDPQENFTGWHFSSDGGDTVRNEGLLPAIDFGGGVMVPSGGDPIDVATPNCTLLAGDLNYDPSTFFPNGIGLYKSTPATLASCGGGTDPSCWPDRKVVVKSDDPHVFLDKPWIHADNHQVWVVYTEFVCPDVGCTGDYTSNSIKAVRCDLSFSCSSPILISGDQPSIQFGDVTIAPDGSTYVTWEQDNDLATDFQPPERMKFWLRVAPPGSTTFGPPRLVAQEPRNAGLAPLHANDFRIATYPKSDVRMVHGKPRVYVVWEGCRARPLGDSTCEEPAVKLRFSDDKGATWSRTKALSAGGDNYFPTISANRGGRHLAVAWYTNRFDPVFHNRQDVELAAVRPDGTVADRQRLTNVSNESEADPVVGGAFIGDYFEVSARADRVLVAFNANYRSIKLLGEGVPVPQQDNYLIRSRF
ncbi:hypothetical protein ACT8ZV_07605 [Nocardioides sp. MAHUQ-72]|uniref:hypothetical protein n=1 Tax=unclassified Nocardioides TaxID=2615069 RepID=UPI003623FCE1